MAPDNTHDEADDDDVDYTSPPEGADTSKAEAALKAKLSRKRTKTGCLTCRKRRIKCDEQRPVCKNCIKSKRHCDGYSQRIMFRPPHFEYRPAPNGGAHITFQAGPMAAPMLPVFPGQVPQYMFDPNAYTATVPRPEAQFMPYAQQPQGYVGLTPQQMPLSGFPVPPQPMPVQYPAPSIAEYGLNSVDQQQQQQQPAQASFQPSFYTSGMQSIPTRVQTLPTSHWQNPISQSQQYTPSQPSEVVQTQSAVQGRTESTSTTATSMATPALHQMPQTSITPPQKVEFVQTPVTRDSSSSWSAPNYKPRPELSHPIDYQPRAQSMHGLPQTTPLPPQPVPSAPDLMARHTSDHPTPELYEHQAQFQGTQTYTQWLTEAAVEVCDDDYYDVDSDEDMDIDKPVVQVQDAGRQRTLNKVLMKQHFDVRNMQIRRYDTFLQSGMLDRYNVEQHANPLKNPATARVFAHFIAATGPSLSAFERHPVNSSVLFTEGSVPFSQQGLWTYTMPMAALHHQGLLHAMLALSSLHIARLQGASVTPSIQHYAWALKRIHSCVGSQNPKKRLQVTTIAASMLLGFYEIMTADHMKWNTHLMGAKQLFIETDFAGMTRQYRKLKREKMARDQLQRRRNSISGFFNDQDDFQSSFHDVDEAMISTFVGREVRYEGFGYVEAMESKIPPPLDLSNFEILKDLFWWYCKQDAYQSIVSGNPLLMDYSRWADCPPRAAMGRPDAVYGSFDHLILLLGRIADFSAKDRPRKLKQMALNGGQWRPPPSMNMPRPPQPPPGQPPAQGPPPAQAGPAFFGMAPPPRQNVQMPSSYRSAQNTQVPQDPSSPEAFDIQAATDAALEEYGRIRAALRAFKNALSGEGFQHLAEDCHTPLQTSFGPALFYRSYDIGCLWSIYNMCEIIAIRSHPHMHPAMHAAAAIAAKETTYYAEQIGRIAAGIVPGPSNEPLNPTLGSALCESCMPSFFAAIQYQGAQQRKETIMRILSISFRTGWGSAELIAAGIETSWVKAAEAGRGPPYQRAMRPQYSEDPRLNGSWQRIDPNEQVDESEMDDSDRRLVKSKANARLNWAVGVIGTEDDLKN